MMDSNNFPPNIWDESINCSSYIHNRLPCKHLDVLTPQHSITYTPQQNGVAKRKNRSLKEMTTCMMESKTLPPKFWAEAINYESYIQNRVPHKQLYGMTPFKSQSRHKLDVTHFKIFGSKAWDRIPTENRKALHPQSQEFLFVGYFEYSKGYKLIKLITNKIFH